MLTAFKFLSSYLKAFRWQVMTILTSVIIISSAVLGLGYGLKYLIDQGFASQNPANLNHAFLFLLAMIVILAIASYNRSLRVNWICEQLEANIKKDAFKNIIRISPSYFELHRVSDIISRLTSDLGLVTNSITMIASTALRNIIMAFGGLIMLSLCSLKLTFYVLITLPIILLPIIYVGRKIRKLSKENQQNIASCSAQMEESVGFIKIVQAYTLENFATNNFNHLVDETLVLAHKRIRLRSLFFATAIGLILSAIAFVLWIGGQDVLTKEMTAGSLSSFIFYAVIVASSLGGLSETYSDIARSMGALDRIIEIIHAKSSVTQVTNPLKLSQQPKLNLIIENLSFCYPSRPAIKVLNNISFKVDNYKTIAIVGPSGAGKSSIFQLLLRFYDPSDGRIRLNDVDIKNLSLADLRAQFALVSQDPVIFSTSAYDNILYGNINATMEEVIAAAKAAEIYDFFASLPDGLGTYLGEKGMKISGGQKQRIAIARAILRDPKILLLDEATSALDSENEQLVQLALAKLAHQRTTIVIAHRISTIINADIILVLDKGMIIAADIHDNLLKSCDLYQRLCSNAFAAH